MIQTLRFFTNFSNLQNFQKFQNTDESPYFYMNHDRTRDEMPPPAHFSKLTKHRGECVLLQDDCFQISTFACMKPWKLLDSEFLVNAPWLKVAKEKCELPNGKVIDDFYTLWQPDWVLILARTKEGKWVMTEQYRHGTGKIALEFPAGIIDKGETPEEAAIRELQEECGYGVKRENAATRLQTTNAKAESRGKASFDKTEAQHLGLEQSDNPKTRDERCETVSSSSCRGTADASSKVLIKKMTGSFVASPLRMTSESDADASAGSLQPCSAQAATLAKNDNNGVMYVGSFPVNPDRHRGKFHVVFIDGVERLGKTHFDDTEEIETFLHTDEEFQAKIADGTFDHPLQIAGYYKWALTQK